MTQISQEIYDKVIKKMKNEGVSSYPGYKTIINETINDYLRRGHLTDHDNLELIEDRLLHDWKKARRELKS